MSRTSGTLPVVQDKEGLSNLLKVLEPKIADIIPDERTRRRLIMLASVAASKTPLLYQCTKESLSFGIMTAAELGLDFSGALKQAYLIPFRNGKTGQYEAVFIPGWRGLRDKALETSSQLNGVQISGLFAQAVRENDEHSFIDLEPETMRPRAYHKKAQDDRGELVAAYAAWMENGEPQVHWMWADEINKRRACSRGQSKPDSPWNKWPDEMWEKTVMRDAIDKRLPISLEARAAIAVASAQEEKAGFTGFIDVESEDTDDDEKDSDKLPLTEEA